MSLRSAPASPAQIFLEPAMNSPHQISLSVLTSRYAAVRLVRPGSKYSLPEALAWSLTTNGNLVAEGAVARIVLPLDGLSPDTEYELTVATNPATQLHFRTRACRGLVDIQGFGARQDLPDNAKAIAAAIAATPVGGTLLVPAGRWLTGPLFLKSGITLHLAEGAVLQSVSDRDAIEILPSHHSDGRMLGTWEGEPAACYASLITAIDCTDIALVGTGILDGGGDAGDWWTWPKETRNGARRSRTIFLSACDKVTISGLTVCNSPSWTVHPVYCRDVVASALTVLNPPESPNTDGFNPESCENVLIEGVHFSVGDDCIAIKSGKRSPVGDNAHLAPTRNVTIRHCRMERGHGGVVIGSEMSGSVTGISIHDCEFVRTDRGLRIKTRRGRGGEVSQIAMRDCTMDGVDTAFVANAFYFYDADGRSNYVQSRAPAIVDQTTPNVRDIAISAITIRDLRVAVGAFMGLPEAHATGISISDLDVTYDNSTVGDVPDMASDLPVLLHGGIVSDFAEVKTGGVLRPENLSEIQGMSSTC